MQFLESRKFTVREICRFFGVQPSFVFDDTSNNYKSAEMANITFLSMTLDPILKRIEAEFNRKLISRSQYTKRAFKFDRRGIYSLDLQSLAEYQKKTIESGIYTINDWRRLENLPEVPGGDVVHVSTNLAPLGSDKLSGNNNTQNSDQ
jgi:HK97 family phage portal protein